MRLAQEDFADLILKHPVFACYLFDDDVLPYQLFNFQRLDLQTPNGGKLDKHSLCLLLAPLDQLDPDTVGVQEEGQLGGGAG